MMSSEEPGPNEAMPPLPPAPAPIVPPDPEVRDALADVEPPDGGSSTSQKVRVQAKRVLNEVEATPVIGDAYDWLRAIALGVKDSAEVMLDEGRKGAKEAEREAWRRFDEKTKFRRKK